MNILPIWKREHVLKLKADGATLREIAKAVGCHRDTVAAYVGRHTRQRKALAEALELLDKELAARGIDVCELNGWLQLFAHLHFECPLHPEASPDEDVGPDEPVCRLCRADGLRRHHKRAKAAGRPILPPWRRPSHTTSTETGGRDD